MRLAAIGKTTLGLALGVALIAGLGLRDARADDAPPPLETIEILTGGASAEDVLPIIVAVHGLGDTPRHFAQVFEAFPERARIVLPRGIDHRGTGFSWFPIPRKVIETREFASGIERSRDRLVDLLERLPKEHRAVGRPVLTGFSQGGILSFAVALERPDLLARVVPVAGWLPQILVPEGDATPPLVPIRALHGAADKLLPPGPTERLVATLTGRGWDVTLQVFPGVAHEIRKPVRDALYAELAAGIDSPP